MQLKNPNHIGHLIKGEKTGEDELADFYIKNPDDELFNDCQAIIGDPSRKSYVEASLLATDDAEHIANVLEMPQELIELYAKIYYNVKGFDRLSRMSLITQADNKEDQTLKMWAVSQGINFIAWRLGKRVTISAVEGLSDLFNDCIYKSKEAIFTENASIASRESAKWVKLSVDIGKLLKTWVTDSKAAGRDIELALKAVSPEFTPVADIVEANQTDTNLEILDASKMVTPKKIGDTGDMFEDEDQSKA